MHGRLRNESLVVTISTECAHCHEPMVIEADEKLNCSIKRGGERPLVFEPSVDWNTFSEPNIIHAY